LSISVLDVTVVLDEASMTKRRWRLSRSALGRGDASGLLA
jgi:hypothetical protein